MNELQVMIYVHLEHYILSNDLIPIPLGLPLPLLHFGSSIPITLRTGSLMSLLLIWLNHLNVTPPTPRAESVMSS